MPTNKYSNSQVKLLDNSNFRNKNKKVFTRQPVFNGNTSFIIFYANWCPACNNIAPTMKILANKLKPYNILFGAVDCDKTANISNILKIGALPSLFIVKRTGRLIPYSGNYDTGSIIKEISDHI